MRHLFAPDLCLAQAVRGATADLDKIHKRISWAAVRASEEKAAALEAKLQGYAEQAKVWEAKHQQARESAQAAAMERSRCMGQAEASGADIQARVPPLSEPVLFESRSSLTDRRAAQDDLSSCAESVHELTAFR